MVGLGNNKHCRNYHEFIPMAVCGLLFQECCDKGLNMFDPFYIIVCMKIFIKKSLLYNSIFGPLMN